MHPNDQSGFSPRFIVDVHKLLAAANVIDDTDLTFEEVEGLKTVCALGTSTSPRINLMFRSNNRLRTESFFQGFSFKVAMTPKCILKHIACSATVSKPRLGIQTSDCFETADVFEHIHMMT